MKEALFESLKDIGPAIEVTDKKLLEHIDIKTFEEAEIESEQQGLSVMWDGTPFTVTIERTGEGQVDVPEILSFLKDAMYAQVERGDVYYKEEQTRGGTEHDAEAPLTDEDAADAEAPEESEESGAPAAKEDSEEKADTKDEEDGKEKDDDD